MPTHSTYSSSVDVATGSVLSYGFDFYLNGVIPLEIERLWFSDSDFSGRLGYGVHSIFDVELKIDEESIGLLTKEGDSKGHITKIIAPYPEYQSKPEDNALTVAIYEYDTEGNLIKETNAAGDSMHFEYDNTKNMWQHQEN